MAKIVLNDISLQFRVRQARRITLKEYLVRRLYRKAVNPVIEVNALQNITLDLHDGDRLGIIGHNGAGKSTLLKLMAGVYPPSSGVRDVEGRISSLFDIALGFEGDASGWDNIRYRGYLQGETPRSIQKKIQAIAEFSELGKFLDMPVRYYSAGMMIRLAFSIASSIEPDVLLIDEVLAAGDLSFQNKARERMQELMQKASLMVLISHDLEVLPKLCSKAIWMDHGRIVMAASPREVIAAYRQSVSKVNGGQPQAEIPAKRVEKPSRTSLFSVKGQDVILPAMTALEFPSDRQPTTAELPIANGAAPAKLEAAVFGIDPLYNLKSQFGLDEPAKEFNYRGRNEWYFLSSNGSNPAGDSWYVLMPDGGLYTWAGSSLDLSLRQTPIAELPALYANPELLVNIGAPATPEVVATCSQDAAGGRLTLRWPAGYRGTFLAAVFISHGDRETQQSFLVTVGERNQGTLPFTVAA